MDKMLQSVSDFYMDAYLLYDWNTFSRRSNVKVDMCRFYILQGVILS